MNKKSLGLIVLLLGIALVSAGLFTLWYQSAHTSPVSVSFTSAPTSTIPEIDKINGITVPPEPDLVANNATLVGIDSNNNGVRDDAERMIASLSKKDTYEAYTLHIAKLEQRLATESISSQTLYNDIRNEESCLNRKRSEQEQEILSSEDIRSAIVNTRERSAQYTANDKSYGNNWSDSGGATCVDPQATTSK